MRQGKGIRAGTSARRNIRCSGHVVALGAALYQIIHRNSKTRHLNTQHYTQPLHYTQPPQGEVSEIQESFEKPPHRE